MEEATASVTVEFLQSKALKKSALDAAIATIKGDAASSEDPVNGAFVKFFQAKAAAAAKEDDGSETAVQRAALIAKVNAVAKSEGFFFDLDGSGKPKMTV